MELFEKLLIETHGFCNRACPTCLTQTYPSPLNRHKILPTGTVGRILIQAKGLGFDGPVGFVWFNEPLMDSRLPSFIWAAKEMGFYVYIDTNGDFLDEVVAEQIKGLDEIVIGTYDYFDDPETCLIEQKRYHRILPDTKISFSGEHITTHFSPRRDLMTRIDRFKFDPCYDLRKRMIITCTGEMALCCEDIACHWNLGNTDKHSLEELWFSPRHQEIIETLGWKGGRQHYEYCRTCPRTG